MILTLAAISLASSEDLSFDFNLFLDHSVGEGLVIDRNIQICQYHSSSSWRVLFSSYSLSILIPNIPLYSYNKNGEEDTESVLFRILIRGQGDNDVILGQSGIDEVMVILGRDDDDVVVILGRGGNDVILGRGGVNEVVVILA
ncbi:hypothetical protein C1645_839593 [Glomus cerebriforme]|uniref:Uncharacterized protein n=1 Tax=Glomus cerebriforme TaxID=658196 RepID=A0A397S0I9_9GLOM|nr:hypothetical protein C1645_839593 [Glomus cerebriforme]